MKNLLSNAPNIIKESQKSPLGIVAMVIMAISIIALSFFNNANVYVKVFIFAIIIIAYLVLAFTVLKNQK